MPKTGVDPIGLHPRRRQKRGGFFVLLVLTNSHDATTSVVCQRLPDLPVFRYNLDLWRDYQFVASPDGFSITDPTGRICSSDSIRAVYVRKPMFWDKAPDQEEQWARDTAEQIFKEIAEWADAEGRLALVHPGKGRWSKMRQMRVARRFFPVPDWRVTMGVTPAGIQEPAVVKTLTQAVIADDRVLFVREAPLNRLSPSFPWFVQEKQNAEEDVTVVWVQGGIFAFALNRHAFDGQDCRVADVGKKAPWRKVTLASEEEEAVRGFMAETGLSFGRFDFLRCQGRLVFLELNPNGQFAWLDLEDQHGLLSAVADAIREDWTRNQPDGAKKSLLPVACSA